MMVIKKQILRFFFFIIVFIVCLVMSNIIFFPKSTMSRKILINEDQPSASSNHQLMVHSENRILSGNLSLSEQKISPLGVNHDNTRSKDVNSQEEEVKKIDNSKKANIVNESDVHEPCNDSLCLNFLSVEAKKRFYSCQGQYEKKKSNPIKRTKLRGILNMSESCHFKEGRGKYIVRMGRNMV